MWLLDSISLYVLFEIVPLIYTSTTSAMKNIRVWFFRLCSVGYAITFSCFFFSFRLSKVNIIHILCKNNIHYAIQDRDRYMMCCNCNMFYHIYIKVQNIIVGVCLLFYVMLENISLTALAVKFRLVFLRSKTYVHEK